MNEELTSKRTQYELIAVLVLLIFCVFFYYKWDTSVKDHDAYVAGIEAKRIKDANNKPMEEVTAREKNVYPQINNNIAQINKDIKSLNETVKRLEKNTPTKDQSNEKFKNKTITEINKFFNDSGYSNSISSGK